jgi:predicted phage terminase large subunit-like protein
LAGRLLENLSATEAERAEARAAAVPPFGDWLRLVTPTFDWSWRHLAYIRERLEKVTRGECRRLLLSVPPRHGKSTMVTVRYPTWRLERDPTLRILVASYNQLLASKFSRQARRIAEGRLELARDRGAVDDWETTAGGGVRAVGVGAGVTGHGADLIIIDDPIRSREDAESELFRERLIEWFHDDLWTRQEPGAAIIQIATRWHENDLAGHLLTEMEAGGERWESINLPAVAEEGDPLGRAPGEALCPERYPLEELEAARCVLGSYSFSALYQGRPAPREGGFFKRAWFEIVEAAPAAGERARYWDKAATQGDGDYTAGVLMARAEGGVYYVLDVVRGQWSPGQREQVIRQTAQLDAEQYGRVRIFTEQEPGSGGKESALTTVRNLAGYPVFKEPVTGAKEVRAEPFAAQAEAGNVRLVRGAWNRAYLDELCSFPSSRYDDQVDASSGAFNKLNLRRERSGGWRSTRGGFL